MSFQNKVVLVTGASAGIGEATAILFAKKGAKLGIVGRNEANLKKVATECERLSGYPALVVVADLSTDAGCEETVKKTINHFGRLDVLVNNVGVGARTCIQNADMETFDRVFNTDVRGVYNLTRLLVPALVEAKGNIVNVSSVAATMVNVGSLPYGMAKAALDHFTRLIALELAPKGVRVNTISPGITVWIMDVMRKKLLFNSKLPLDIALTFIRRCPNLELSYLSLATHSQLLRKNYAIL